ncbi:MAG: Ig domain-containing protein [Ruminococcaceae bacterium]|nr:Ig domain-containing protein [Oscillospiraceae bacterium]
MNLKVVLNGKNTVKGTIEREYNFTRAVAVIRGSLTVSGTGSLNVSAKNSGTAGSAGIIGYYGVNIRSGNVSITTKSNDASYGIAVGKGAVKLDLQQGSSVEIITKVAQYWRPVAIEAKKISIGSGGTIVQKLGSTKSGAKAGKIQVENWEDIKRVYSGYVKVQNISDEQFVRAEGVALNTTAKTVKKGKTYTLKATLNPGNASNKAVTWKSSSSKVASVSSRGVVTAKKKGKTTITATTVDGKFTAKCVITVK